MLGDIVDNALSKYQSVATAQETCVEYTELEEGPEAHHKVVVEEHFEVGVHTEGNNLCVVRGRLPDVLGHALSCMTTNSFSQPHHSSTITTRASSASDAGDKGQEGGAIGAATGALGRHPC